MATVVTRVVFVMIAVMIAITVPVFGNASAGVLQYNARARILPGILMLVRCNANRAYRVATVVMFEAATLEARCNLMRYAAKWRATAAARPSTHVNTAASMSRVASLGSLSRRGRAATRHPDRERPAATRRPAPECDA